MTKDTILYTRQRLIGYYNKLEQDMKIEQLFCSEAEELAILYEESFQGLTQNPLTDSTFRSILQSKAVFILKNTEGKLFAYFPSKKIARISNVKFNNDDINPIPLQYKAWFIPGQIIQVESRRERKYTITKSGRDFLITFDGKTLPLDWSEDDYVSVSDLNRILHDAWTEHVEVDTDDCCGDCDGYDYSNCDMSRCKNDCENCGGRRHICNNSCFYYRYDRALRLVTDQRAIANEIMPLHKKMDYILTPHCPETESTMDEVKAAYNNIEKRMTLFEEHFDISFEKIKSKYQLCMSCVEKRAQAQNATDSEVIDIRTSERLIRTFRKDITIRTDGLLFWKSYHLIGTVYNITTDGMTTIDYRIDFKTKKERKDFSNAISGKMVRNIVLLSTDNERFSIKSVR